jgi:glycerol-3-phosphate dehydrogenase
LSTYRSLAEKVTTRLLHALGRADGDGTTHHEPLVPGTWRPSKDNPAELRLWRIYGAVAGAIMGAMQCDPNEAATLCPHTLDTIAQARYAVRREGALTVADVLLRRTPTGWGQCMGLDAAPAAALVLAQERGWDEDEIQRACAAYRREVVTTFRPNVGAVQCFE